MVLPQAVLYTRRRLGEGLLALRVADDGGQRVEEVEEGGLVPGELRVRRLRRLPHDDRRGAAGED